MGLLDSIRGKNKESLDAFLRRMLKPLMATDPDSSLPGYFDALSVMSFEQLCGSIPATIMTIVEQYDFNRSQGASHDEALGLIDSHRRSLIAVLENEEIGMDHETGSYPKLPQFIEYILNREYGESFGPFFITQDYIRLVIEETRVFVKENPKNTILAMQQRRQ